MLICFGALVFVELLPDPLSLRSHRKKDVKKPVQLLVCHTARPYECYDLPYRSKQRHIPRIDTRLQKLDQRVKT